MQLTGVALSWSWLCSTGKVEYEDCTAIGFAGRVRPFAAEIGKSTRSSSVDTSKEHNVSFLLTLKTYIFQAQIVLGDTEHDFGAGNDRIAVSRDHVHYDLGTLQPDRRHMPDNLSFLPLCVDQESMVTYLLGLCAKRSVVTENVFERCGMICFAFWGQNRPDLTMFSSDVGLDDVVLV